MWSPIYNAAAPATFRMPRGGAVATVSCSGIRGKPGLLIAPSSHPLPFSLGSDDMPGIQVFVNGALAPILSVEIPANGESGATKITFQVPLERNVAENNSDGWDRPLPFVSQEGLPRANQFLIPGGGRCLPAFGAFYSNEKGYVQAEHGDHSPVTPDNPAHPGETITVFGSDFFPVWPPPPMGVPVPQEPRYLAYPSRGNPPYEYRNLYLQKYPEGDNDTCWAPTTTPALQIVFQGLAPGMIGVQQIDFIVPDNQPSGDWALFIDRSSCPDGSGQFCDASETRVSPSVLLPVR